MLIRICLIAYGFYVPVELEETDNIDSPWNKDTARQIPFYKGHSKRNELEALKKKRTRGIQKETSRSLECADW